jgi:uncharacterized membrane protein YqhA
MKYLFEKLLLSCRLFVLLPVIFGLIGSISLFLMATYDMLQLASNVLGAVRGMSFPEALHFDLVSDIIGAVDLYLIAIVLLIFSFGLYELFISDMGSDSGKKKIELPSILSISSLDELKDKLAKVIVMVLVVSFFQHVIYIKFSGSIDMLYFAISIAALSVGVYLLHKDSKFKKKFGGPEGGQDRQQGYHRQGQRHHQGHHGSHRGGDRDRQSPDRGGHRE